MHLLNQISRHRRNLLNADIVNKRADVIIPHANVDRNHPLVDAQRGSLGFPFLTLKQAGVGQSTKSSNLAAMSFASLAVKAKMSNWINTSKF